MNLRETMEMDKENENDVIFIPKHSINNLQQQQHRLLQEKNVGISPPGVTRPSFASQPSSNLVPEIDYLELPTLRWMNLLPDGEEFLEGNSIQVSPFDESILYATSRSGSLLVFSASTGSIIETVRPSPRTLTEDGATSTWSLYSKSGLAFGSYPIGGKESADDNYTSKGYNDFLDYILNGDAVQVENEDEIEQQLRFVVFSVVDQAPNDSRFLPKTRVVCVSIPEHRILWTSSGLPGTSQGSPLVYHSLSPTTSDNENTSDGIYIVLIHNSVLVRPDNSSRTTGHITVLEPVDGHVKWTQSEWSRDEIPKGYGSPEISRSPIFGGESSGGSRDNPNDVIAWTSSDQDGRGRVGNLFAFQMKSATDITAMNVNNSVRTTTYDPFETRVLKQVRWNSIARPTLNRNGTNLYTLVTGNAVRGWSGVAKFNETADWSKKLLPTAAGTNASSYPADVAITTAPVLSLNEKRLFVVTARNETVCLNSRTGERMWSASTRNSSPLLAEPKVSPDDKRLYIIMSRDGRVVGIDQRNGNLLWGFGCGAELLSSVCEKSSVFADFDTSSDGQYLYYGDADGRIVSLTVGKQLLGKKFNENEGFSSSSSSSSSSTIIISDVDNKGQLDIDGDSTSTSDSILDNGEKNSGKKAGLVVFAIFLSLLVVGGSVMYIIKTKDLHPLSLVPQFNWRNFRFPRNGSSDTNFSATVGSGMLKVENSDHQPENSIYDGTDMYEDKILAKLSDDDGYDPIDARGAFNTLWVDPTHAKPITDDDNLHSSADRMAVLLGTSNRITPINENYGYGQAVMI
eukprot:CAMPEP_0170898720 /NCGR_PEP_ID=MMETSP0734-20130129/46224_1 /TAXON_ID=186038 /ORGANISM="Fragilariopsis kerguelensis, Strain L26-C5" /LENGTH=797 /DNA_ID=CAMNT_0011291539 /DNA_START=416 /DNA_END=2809 /DNA_ORIENTATION=+